MVRLYQRHIVYWLLILLNLVGTSFEGHRLSGAERLSTRGWERFESTANAAQRPGLLRNREDERRTNFVRNKKLLIRPKRSEVRFNETENRGKGNATKSLMNNSCGTTARSSCNGYVLKLTAFYVKVHVLRCSILSCIFSKCVCVCVCVCVSFSSIILNSIVSYRE